MDLISDEQRTDLCFVGGKGRIAIKEPPDIALDVAEAQRKHDMEWVQDNILELWQKKGKAWQELCEECGIPWYPAKTPY